MPLTDNSVLKYSLAQNRMVEATDAEVVGKAVAQAEGAAAAELVVATHEAETTGAHGGIVSGTDPRLTDARTPTAHTHPKADVGLGGADNTPDADKPVSTAQQAALNAKASLTGAAFTGAVTSASPSAGIGYAAGSGGAVTQLVSKSTGVTLNKICGKITMAALALAAAAEVSFVVTNSVITAADVVVVNHCSGGTGGAYAVHAHTVGNGSFAIMVANMSTGSLSQAIVLNFVVLKASSA